MKRHISLLLVVTVLLSLLLSGCGVLDVLRKVAPKPKPSAEVEEPAAEEPAEEELEEI